MRSILPAIAAAAATFLCAPAPAQNAMNLQNAAPVVGVTHELDSGWFLDPVVANGQIVAVFAQLPPGTAVGSNVTLLLLTHNGDATWSMLGWKDASIPAAVAFVRQAYNNGALLDDLYPIAAGHSADQLAINDCTEPAEPVYMPYGLLPDDPSAGLADAIDPKTMAKLIEEGAAGAPDLSVLLVTSNECKVSELDITLDVVASDQSKILGLGAFEDTWKGVNTQTTLAACLRICIPWTWTTWGGWGAWGCTGGPTPIAGCAGSGGCRYTGCTRTRAGTKSHRSWNCTVTTTPVTQTQGPQNKTCAQTPPGSGICPPSPPPGC